MNNLVHEDNETPTSVKSRKWKKIKNSETEGNHGSEDNDATQFDAITSETNKNATNSDWSTYAGSCFLFLFTSSCIRKTRRNNPTKGTEGKTYLMIDFSHTREKCRKELILITFKNDIGGDIGTNFTINWSDGDIFFFLSSAYMHLNKD